ncbi:MAG: hypothetical protein WCB49_05625 [Gammaproteobacteria bacterium]
MLDKVTRFSIARPRALALTFKLFGAMTVLVMATLGTATSPQAMPLLWTLHPENVTIGGPVNMSGSFIYDADLDVYSSVAITISGSTAPAANGTYDNFDTGGNGYFSVWNDVNNNGSIDYGTSDFANPDWGLNLAFGVLTNGGGTVGIRDYGIGIGTCAANYTSIGGFACATYSRGGSGQPSGYITASAVLPSPAPLPAALPLFASGLGGLGFFAWGRKKKRAPAPTA